MDGRMEKNKQGDEIAEALLRKAGFRVLEPEMYALYIIISPLYFLCSLPLHNNSKSSNKN